jgi:hypothetical protein
MTISLVSLDLLLMLAWFVLVVAFCWGLYRTLRLSSLPWIGAIYLLSLVTVPLTQLLARRIFPFGADPTGLRVRPEGALVITNSCIEGLGNLLLALLAFSEVAFLVSRAYPESHSRLLAFFFRLHDYVREIGVAALILVVSTPLLTFVFLHFHGPSIP